MKKQHTSILQAIREMIHNQREYKAKERITDALKAHAKAASDAEYHRIMADFYTKRADKIDPEIDWWGFAEAKQKETEHVQDHQHKVIQRNEAMIKVDAEQARYNKLKEEHAP